ncbi:MAG: MMPL family transporter [Candidatus Hydrogenedentota bacterium]
MPNKPDSSSFSPIARIYDATVLKYPLIVLLLTVILTGFFAYYSRDFRLDASSDAIVLESDPDLRYYDDTRDLFGSDDYIIITVTPPDGLSLMDDEVLTPLKAMVAEFEALDDVKSVTSILNVPLFHSPDIPLMKLLGSFLVGDPAYRTLEEDAERDKVLAELTTSPLYSNYLIAKDGTTTAVQVTYNDHPEEFRELLAKRTALKDKRRTEAGLTSEEKSDLAKIETEYKPMYEDLIAQNSESIVATREIVARYGHMGDLHIGGVPMIMADIISYVEQDMRTFGVSIIILVLIVLTLLFRNVRWVILPTLVCILTVLFMFGYLGFTRWNATIVTSNFPSLLFVIALADVLHVVVHYRELHSRNPKTSKRELILQSARDVAVPCFYTSVTTIVGFGSLIVSGIRPVMDFGIMMAIGVGLAYTICFVFFPAALMLFPKGDPPPQKLGELKDSPLMFFARFSEKNRILIYVVSIAVFLIGLIGAQRILVENRFIDYFAKDTPIYQGMTVIDRELGGTTPLEVVLVADEDGYWIKQENLDKLAEIHTWLADLPQTGKAISPHTLIQMLEKTYEGKPIPLPLLIRILDGLPDDISQTVVSPYLTEDRRQVRISMRAKESDTSLNRKDLIATIDEYFATDPVFDGIEPHVTGIFVLYNNLLQSLFTSQIKSIATVFFIIWLMFVGLFRSIRIATIAIIPNILPVTLILGILGWTGTPLDLMTIMTAAITLGIAVDFAIHYIHRFKHEFADNGSYTESMYRTHNSIGRAMFFTTICIIAGFSLLTMSNFIPSIYFGIFTSLAITVAFLASVTLLPLLLIAWKPLGPEGNGTATD